MKRLRSNIVVAVSVLIAIGLVWQRAESYVVRVEERDKSVAALASMAVIGYEQGHRNHFPNAAHWEDDVRPYWPKDEPFSVSLSPVLGYTSRRLAMNRKLSGGSWEQGGGFENVLFYTADTSLKNAHGDPPTDVLDYSKHMTVRGDGVVMGADTVRIGFLRFPSGRR